MKVHGLAVILGIVFQPLVEAQDGHWPPHIVCNSHKTRAVYRSCDPLQDIGLTLLSSCSQIQTEPIQFRLSLLLRQSIEEVYGSLVVTVDGVSVYHHDEPFCLLRFPRFSFCGSKKGEIISLDTSVPALKIPLKGQFYLLVRAMNQNGFQIACVNASLEFN